MPAPHPSRAGRTRRASSDPACARRSTAAVLGRPWPPGRPDRPAPLPCAATGAAAPDCQDRRHHAKSAPRIHTSSRQAQHRVRCTSALSTSHAAPARPHRAPRTPHWHRWRIVLNPAARCPVSLAMATFLQDLRLRLSPARASARVHGRRRPRAGARHRREHGRVLAGQLAGAEAAAGGARRRARGRVLARSHAGRRVPRVLVSELRGPARADGSLPLARRAHVLPGGPRRRRGDAARLRGHRDRQLLRHVRRAAAPRAHVLGGRGASRRRHPGRDPELRRVAADGRRAPTSSVPRFASTAASSP